MGIAAGGKIEQTIVKDTEDPDAWDGKASFTIPVHIVNSQAFHCITGQAPPPTPISASIYARAGLPFYKKYDEPTDIFGTFELVKSVNATEQDRGLATSTESPVHPRTVELNEQGRHHVHPSRVNTRNYIDDPDDLLNLVTEMDECRPLADLQTSLSDLKLVDIENELKQLDELEKTDGSY